MASSTFHHTSQRAGPLEVRDSTQVCANLMCLGLAWHKWLSCDLQVDGCLENSETQRTANDDPFLPTCGEQQEHSLHNHYVLLHYDTRLAQMCRPELVAWHLL